MIHNFDLISDLYLDDAGQFDWAFKPTSLLCLVGGNVASDRRLLYHALRHLSTHYRKVFFIDGLLEHGNHLHDLERSYLELEELTSKIPNVVYLQDRIIVTEGMAIMGTNGWWDFKFNPAHTFAETANWFLNLTNAGADLVETLVDRSIGDAQYIKMTIEKLQRHNDVRKIMILSNSVPEFDIVKHDHEVAAELRSTLLGNSLMGPAVAADTEHKIKTWCFGHYNMPVDRQLNHIQFSSNPQGRPGGPRYQSVYNPKRVMC